MGITTNTHMPSKASSSININGAFDNIIFPPKKKSIYDRRKTRQKKYTGEWAAQASWKSEGFMSVCACKRTRTPYVALHTCTHACDVDSRIVRPSRNTPKQKS